MATHRERADEACRQIPAIGDDRILRLGIMHALLDVADAIREQAPVRIEMLDADEAGNVAKAREYARDYAGYDGEHHKQFALVRIAELLGGTIPEDIERGIPA